MLGPSLGQHGPGQMSWEGGGGGNGGKGMMPLVRSPGDSEMVPVSELALTLHGPALPQATSTTASTTPLSRGTVPSGRTWARVLCGVLGLGDGGAALPAACV